MLGIQLDQNLPAVILAVVLIAILVAVLLYAARVAQPSANRPAGPPTGQASMERKVGAIVAMLAGTALLFLGYGLREPVRQVQAQNDLLDTSIGRGIETYTTLCFTCHGEKGQGAVVPGSQPIRLAPALNRPDLQPTDPDAQTKEFDALFKTISRGIAGSPMPAWNQSDGGPLLDEQVNELVRMIMNGNRTLSYNGDTGTPWQITNTIITGEVQAGKLAALPQQPDVENLPFYQALTPQQQNGVKVILQFNCGGCHTIPNIPGAEGTIGPNEAGVADRKKIAGGAVPNNSVQDLANWIHNPQSLKPGTAMPTLGLSDQQALDAASYLYTLTNGASGSASGTPASSATPGAGSAGATTGSNNSTSAGGSPAGSNSGSASGSANTTNPTNNSNNAGQ